ncbi:MAG: phosphoribosyltransferase family protein [Pseudomonadota bacterium]
MSPLIDEAAIARRVSELAEDLSVHVSDKWTLIALLQGAMPFAVDLMRALARRGINPTLDSLWLESYRDERESSGRVVVRADISRSVEGKHVLLLDDVFDSGRTIAFARAHLLAKGAVETRACAAVRKPSALGLPIEHVGFDAPDVFLVGYGMDEAGRYRGLPYIAQL